MDICFNSKTSKSCHTTDNQWAYLIIRKRTWTIVSYSFTKLDSWRLHYNYCRALLLTLTTVSWIVIWGLTSKPKTYTNNYLESNSNLKHTNSVSVSQHEFTKKYKTNMRTPNGELNTRCLHKTSVSNVLNDAIMRTRWR